MTSFLSAFNAALLHFAWQGVAVFVLIWTTLFVLRKRSANLRYVVSCAALAVLAVAPAVTTWVLYQRPATPSPLTAAVSNFPAMTGAVATLTSSRESLWIAPLQRWVLPVWALGVLLFSLRMVWGCTQIAGLRRRGQPAGDAVLAIVAELSQRLRLSNPVRVLTSAWSGGPSLVGWVRPVILLPASAISGLTPQRLEAVLAHELAHVRRHDYFVNWIQLLIETLLFYHPAVWWISARIRHERELCCDDLAVTACEGAMCYARALTNLEKMRGATPAMALGSTGGALLYRIQRIMGTTEEQYGPSRASGLVALSLALACLLMGVNWARGQSHPSQDYLTQGDVQLRLGSNQLALQQYRQGIEQDPGRRSIYQKRAIETLMRMGNKTEAAEVNAQLLKEHPDDTDGITFGASILLDRGEAVAASRQLEQVIERVPENPVAHLNLGMAYAAQNNGAAARREIEEAIRLRPDFVRAKQEFEKLGAAQLPEGKAPAAVPVAEQLARLQAESDRDPERLDLQVAAGNLAVRAGNYDQAIYTFQRVLDRMDQNAPARGDIYLRLGEAYRRKGDAAGAIPALQKAKELLPDNRIAQISLIMALMSAGRNTEAQRLREDMDTIRFNQTALTNNFLKDELAAAQRKLAELQAARPGDAEAIGQALTNLDELKRKIEIAQQPGWTDSVVKIIDSAGIDAQTRADLVKSLPVHLGDTLTQAKWEATVLAVQTFDGNLRVQLSRDRSDGGAHIRISKGEK